MTTPARTFPKTSVPVARPVAPNDGYGKTAGVTPSYVTGGGAPPSSLGAPSLSGADATGGAPSTDDTDATDSSSDTLAMDGDIETADDALKAFDTDCADPNNTAAKNMPDWMKDNVRQTLQDALNQLGPNPSPEDLHQAVLTAENQAVGQNIMFKAFINSIFQGMLDKMKGSQG